MQLEHVTKRIARIRSRIRSLYLLSGVSRLVVAVVALLLLSFLLDYFLNLPRPVRYASAALALGVVAVLAYRYLAYPLSVRLPDDDLALAAEARAPELRDRLISALQFGREIERGDSAESRALMEAVIADASGLEKAIDIRRLVDPRATRNRTLVAVGAVALVVLGALLAPGVAGVWAQRNLLLSGIEWPRATTLVVVGFEAGQDIIVTRGQSLRVGVRADGRVPDDVEIWYEREDEDGGAERSRMYRVESEKGLFQFEFRQIPASFRFWVTGGDDTDGDPVYAVTALIPPTVETIEAACTFPGYTGMEPTTFREADLELPEGTEVRLTLGTNMPLREGFLAFDDADPVPLRLADDRRSGMASFTADRTAEFSILLTGEEGQQNLPDSVRFRIRAVPDRKPLARVLYPSSRQWYTKNGLVPFKALGADNYGVSRLSLLHLLGTKGDFIERPFAPGAGDPKTGDPKTGNPKTGNPKTGNPKTGDPTAGPGIGELSAPLGSREIVGYVAIPVADLGAGDDVPGPGEEIHFLLEVRDNNGNVDRTQPYTVEIVSEEDLQRKLSQKQASLREKALDAEAREERARSQTDALLEFVREDGSVETRDRERIRDIQIEQGKITREMDRFFHEVASVFNAFLYNRLASPIATDNLLARFDRFLAEDHEELSVVFKRDLYREVIQAFKKGELFENDILFVLSEILEIALRISEETSPQAHGLLTAVSRGESENSLLDDLQTVRDIQTDILADFQSLDNKMRRWETYSELIRDLILLRGTESRIKKGAQQIQRGR